VSRGAAGGIKAPFFLERFSAKEVVREAQGILTSHHVPGEEVNAAPRAKAGAAILIKIGL